MRVFCEYRRASSTAGWTVCGEPLEWHLILGTVISPHNWHKITEGYFRPSDVFPHFVHHGHRLLDRANKSA